jgi:hypothetical protein
LPVPFKIHCRITLFAKHPREMKTYIHTKMCEKIFTATLFIIANIGNNPNLYQVMNKLLKCGILYNVILFGNKKEGNYETSCNMDKS